MYHSQAQTILIEFEYFRSLMDKNTLDKNLHLGLLVNASFSFDQGRPYGPISIPASEKCYCLGSGFKAMLPFKIGKKNYFALSTDLNLIDLGFGIDHTENPFLRADQQRITKLRLNLLRPRIGLDLSYIF